MKSQHPNVWAGRQETGAAERDAMRDARLLFVDNLRWVIIILVVSMHAADTYSPLGNWYYVDRTRLTVPELLVFAAWQMYLQSFFMGLLFFIAGYFVPSSLRRKGPGRFLRDRGFRLGLPALFYMLLLGPVTEYFVAHSWRATHSSFAREWWRHIADLEFLSESGPLWFCVALLIFSVVYTLWRVVSPGRKKGQRSRPPGTTALIGFALVMAVLTFAVRLFQPSGTSFLNMQLGDFPQYILLFAAGVLASREGWLLKLPFIPGIRWLALTLTIGFISWLTILFAGGALHGNVSAYSGGWYWQSAAINLWQAFTCVGLCFGLLVIFREKFDAQSRLTRLLSENAFSVYVFHPPVVIAGARMLQGFVWNPILKFAILTCVSVVGTYVLSEAVLRRVPVLRAIL
jgi:fucose 4-O-acetylase-like acetyltransferase